ncbi:stemmadenine O-acetyltransferase-like [Euphorbia lathyris]|uniref:stemmadenine O-acetyltransferase-like n=1 Tax=Euphorbia lathyris TaxID=212925 RepID=UPI003313B622
MGKIQVDILSKEIIKPSSQTKIHHLKPFKFSLFNQLTPTTYTPIILFYPNINDPNITFSKIIPRLKLSLSQTLTFFYPFSGRVVDNLHIDHFNQGVPLIVAKVSGVGRLSDYLKNPEIEFLNRFLPSQPYFKEIDLGNIPQVAFQVNVFPCGGVVLGWVASHKLIDALSGSCFINAWASISKTGDLPEHMQPNCTQGSVFFPTKNPFPEEHLSLMESLWFTRDNYITRRFVFDAKTISSLRAKATGERDGKTIKPSRIEALTCFIWKCSMAASRAISGTPKASILVEALNLRTRTKPPMSSTSIGDIFWWATAIADASLENKELYELSFLLNDAINLYDIDYMKTLQGEEGFETMGDYCSQLHGLFSVEKPDIFAFTSWCHLGITKVDFGWGEPYWVGILGKAGPEFRNLTVFVDARDGNGIEAWITLDEQRMKYFECDPEFLAYACPNPKISCM